MECVYIVLLLLIAWLMRLFKQHLPAEVPWKRDKIKDFSPRLHNQPRRCSGKVQSCRAKGAGFESYSVPNLFFHLSFFFHFLCCC